MQHLQVPFKDQKSRLTGRSVNFIRLKETRRKAVSEETLSKLEENPYQEIWDIDYYSSTDEEDNDEDEEGED